MKINSTKPKIVVFASGTKDGGGSGFEELSRHAGEGDYEIVAVVSNHEHGGVRERADRLGVPFMHFPAPYTKTTCQEVIKTSGAKWIALSGWLKLLLGADPKHAFNIHPGSLPRFGGPGMYGMHVHEAVIEAFKRGELTHTAVSMHFVAEAASKEDYDKGAVFFRLPVPIYSDDTAKSLAKRTNEAEHKWQWRITSLVVQEKIYWNGKDPKSLVVPKGYEFLPQ